MTQHERQQAMFDAAVKRAIKNRDDFSRRCCDSLFGDDISKWCVSCLCAELAGAKIEDGKLLEDAAMTLFTRVNLGDYHARDVWYDASASDAKIRIAERLVEIGAWTHYKPTGKLLLHLYRPKQKPFGE